MYTKKTFSFNTIYIIESLGKGETKTGKNLYNDVIRWKVEQNEDLKGKFISVADKVKFFSALENIKADVLKQGVMPFIHLEMHGSQNKDGLVLSSGELVTWLELANRFREINLIVGNNILVSMATCYGAYIYSQIRPVDRSPFWGFVGPWETVSSGDIEISFNAFFDSLLSSFDFNEAIKRLNEENNLPHRYAFYNSEMVFDRVYGQYEQRDYEPANYEKRVLHLISEASKDFYVRTNLTDSEIRAFIEHQLINQKEEFKKKYREYFLMEDLQ